MYESSCSYQTALDLKRTSPIAQVKSEECFGITQCSPDWASYRFHQSTFEQLKQSVEKAKAVLQDRTGFLGTSAFSDIYSTPRLTEPLENASSFTSSAGIIGISGASTSISGSANANSVSQRHRIETLKTTSASSLTQTVDSGSCDSRHRQEKSHGSSTTANGMNNALRSVKCEGIKLFLSVRFSTPRELEETTTADPLDPDVKNWWESRVNEIYRSIPDFGGFLVKASSEGQPGPADYGRSHAEGANMLATALQNHNGVVIWRAFVYSEENPDDRAKQSYSEFKPLDGQFASNVILQVKNGAIDFQPREPFHPLFGGMTETPIALEVQLTKEYLGMATHLAYLGHMWEEVLAADTFVKGNGSTVSRVIDGTLFQHSLTAIAGVANIGNNRDWTGSHFNQANWYVYGRLAWDPDSSTRRIAEEWLRLTFSNDPVFVIAAADIMMRSREVLSNYMTPLGLAHLMATGHHYGPGPWINSLSRPEWNPAYYHNADINGIGFDRTETGSNALSQYAREVASKFEDLNTMDERYLLWFHHLSWDYQLQSGSTLWDSIVLTYSQGVEDAKQMSREWETLKPYVDTERFENIAINLRIQEREAKWWRDACVAYFQSISNKPLPAGVDPPEKSLAEYIAMKYPYAPGSLTIPIERICIPSSISTVKPSFVVVILTLMLLSFIFE